MSYNKTIWKSKDIITREKMQKIEDQLEVLSEQGASGSGSGTSNYLELENKPQINGVTLTGNKSLTDLGAAAASDVAAKYTKPETGIPASDLSSTVQASLQKADTALQGENLTSVVNNYIETNFNNPSSPPLDRTLSSSASAAPADMVGELKSAVNDITGVIASKNLYDKSSCNPQNAKYNRSSDGALTDGGNYATTGKIQVQAETQYTFSATTYSTAYARVNFFSGETGETFISQQSSSGNLTFATPENCTFISVNLFARNHTEQNYSDAINAAQLELGDHATAYVPYGDTVYVPLDVVGENGDLEKMFDEIHGKNIYDKNTAAHEDGKAYNNSTGVVFASSYYAMTGIIPCSGGCVYTFSSSAKVKSVVFFSDGIFRDSIIADMASTPFTFEVPLGCNGAGINLFSAFHTTEEYTAAINSAQLEAGDRATAYEAYNSASVPGYSFIEQGIGVNVGKTISQKAITDLLAYPKRTTWWHSRKGDSLGDSITYKFNNFQKFVKAYLGLADFYNNGMTGTNMAGPADPTWGDSMWMDSRINALHADADFITILGGANDGQVNIGTIDLTNCDTDTYAGAFNVIISKIYYRYLALSAGYYQTIDYTGVNKLSTPHNVLILPCTQFYVPGGIAKLSEKAEAIRTLSRLWALRVVDFYADIQANPCVADVYWSDSDRIHPNEDFYRERLSPILIDALTRFQPIEYGIIT